MPTPNPRVHLALQLYSVRDAFAKAPADALKKVAEAGYTHVEWFGGFWGKSPEEWAELLDTLELKVLAAHVGFSELTGHPPAQPIAQPHPSIDLGSVLDDYETLGCSRIVCPYLDEAQRSGPAAFKRAGEALNLAAYQLRGRGFRLAYHNHDFEFLNAEGLDGLQTLLSCGSSGSIAAEVDVFWVAWAGVDPELLLRDLQKGPNRLLFLHLKDGLLPDQETRQATSYEDTPFRPLGQGDLALSLEGIVRAGLEAGVEGLIVEQDTSLEDPFRDARQSLEALLALECLEGYRQ